MKKATILLLISFQSIIIVAQEGNFKNTNQEKNYFQIKKFLIDHRFNASLFQDQFNQWFTLARKKEFASAIQVDSRHVIQTIPLNYTSKDLTWISPYKSFSYRDNYQYKNSSIGQQLAQDVVNDIGSSMVKKIGRKKYRYNAANNNKSYYTPSFLRF